jgi:hypothetical protein
MTRDEWTALAERCEKANPDSWHEMQQLAFYICKGAQLAGFSWHWPTTTSLEAIAALIKLKLPGIPGDVGIGALAHGETKYHAVLYVGGDDSSHCGDAATPALSACAAFCRAMAAKEPRP